jgi:NAD(P)H-dependent FMN reductase
MKVLAFSGSNSSQSINQKLIRYTAKNIPNVRVVDLRDYSIPMYSFDEEKNNGIPLGIKKLLSDILDAEGIIISTPEHNSLMPAFFKNILDWLSRTGVKYLAEKKIIIMSTSDGGRGAVGAAESVEKMLSRADGSVTHQFNLPHFTKNFDADKEMLINHEYEEELLQKLEIFK